MNDPEDDARMEGYLEGKQEGYKNGIDNGKTLGIAIGRKEVVDWVREAVTIDFYDGDTLYLGDNWQAQLKKWGL